MKHEPHEQQADADLAESLQRAYDSIPIPDGEAAWQRIGHRIDKDKRRRRWLRSSKYGAYAASLLAAFYFTVWAINPAFAFPNLYSMVVKKSKDGTVHVLYQSMDRNQGQAKTAPPPDDDEIVFGNDAKTTRPPDGGLGGTGSANGFEPGAKTGPPPPYDEHGNELQPRTVPPTQGNVPPDTAPPSMNPDEGKSIEVVRVATTVLAARKVLDFPVLAPAEIPEGFELKSAELHHFPGEKPYMFTLMYENNKSTDGAFIQITETKLLGERVGSFSSFGGKPEVKQIDIRGSKAVLILTKRTARLEWNADGAVYEMMSTIGEDAAVKLARALKDK